MRSPDLGKLSLEERTALCIYISCWFTVGEIFRDIEDRFDIAGDVARGEAIRATAFWVYYWLTEDIYTYDVLRMPESEAREMLNQLTALFVEDFSLPLAELRSMLDQVRRSETVDKSNVFLALASFFGNAVGNDLIERAEITAVVQSHFPMYHQRIHDMIELNKKPQEELILDFYENYRGKRKS
jgi:hypothetical protein